MPREKRLLHRRRDGICEEMVTETFTLRQDLPDGSVIRNDGKNLWMARGCSFYGPPPKGWDESKAVEDNFRRQYEMEADYS